MGFGATKSSLSFFVFLIFNPIPPGVTRFFFCMWKNGGGGFNGVKSAGAGRALACLFSSFPFLHVRRNSVYMPARKACSSLLLHIEGARSGDAFGRKKKGPLEEDGDFGCYKTPGWLG